MGEEGSKAGRREGAGLLTPATVRGSCGGSCSGEEAASWAAACVGDRVVLGGGS